jgi:hypothetical protein
LRKYGCRQAGILHIAFHNAYIDVAK